MPAYGADMREPDNASTTLGRIQVLRAWVARVMATRRRRVALAGSTIAVVGVAILFMAGFFSDATPQAGVPETSPGASEPIASGALPVEVGRDTSFEMMATTADAIGVDPATEFILASSEDLDADAVRALLHVEPAVELSVARESAGRYRIGATEPLHPGTVYRFLVADETMSTPHVLASFAFQTKASVGILQTVPRHESTGVPVNTGIELTFAQEGVQGLEEHFQIEPAVPGRFEAHGRITVFVPEGGLAPATLYTVTVTGGLAVEGSADVMVNDFVVQFETEIDATVGVPASVVNFTRRTAESSPSEAPALETNTYEPGEVRLSVKVYRFDAVGAFVDSLDAFDALPAWAGATREAYVTDTTPLSQVATFDADLQRLPVSGRSFIQFPAPLPAGFYLVDSAFNGRPLQAWLQVTDIATYAALAEDRTLVWANDLSTQAPIADARVEFVGTDVAGETGVDGTLTLASPEQAGGNLLVTAPDGRAAIVPLSSRAESFGYFAPPGGNSGDDYWDYLSVDRPLYLPSDTVRFWGIARPRENPGPRTVTVRLMSHSYLGYDYQPVVVAETDVETNALGTFSGELAFAGLSPSGYRLTTSVDGQVIREASVEVQTYTKPAYQISVAPDRLAAFAGDEITFSIDATFLEGSPVPGLALSYGGAAEGQVTTDDTGHAAVTVIAGAEEPGYVATESYVNVTPVRPEEGEIVGAASASVHPASVTALATTDVEGDQGVISGTVREVDLTRINEGTFEGPDDFIGGLAGGVTVSLGITDVAYRQTEIGEYYDFIAKVVRKHYRYDLVETGLGTFTTVTDASGAFLQAFPVDPARDYRIDMQVQDGQGRTESHQLYLSGSQDRSDYAASNVYLADPDGVATFYGGGAQFAIDTQVSLAMHRGTDVLPSGGENRYLFIKAQSGIHDYAVQAGSTYRFDFTEADVPNVTVSGVWFNGRTYAEVNYGYQVRLDPAERELEIEISPDEDRYGPGDQATLDITVSDGDGNRQRDTEVNIAVVDEALFLSQGANTCVCALDAVYAPVSPGILRTYASHQVPTDVQSPGFGATTGGPRSQFADVAFHGAVTTDADGHASISFELPDNLTSWRVTAEGFNDRLMAGGAMHRIVVGLPFFADVTLSDEYLVTDEPELRLRSFGRALGASDSVTFSVAAPSLGLDTPIEVTAPAFQAAHLSLPELHEGTHEVLIEARSGALEDSLVRTIRVVASRLVSAQTRYYDVVSGLRVEGSETGPTRVVFSDEERGRYVGVLQRLTWGYGDRLDQRLARDVSADLLATFYDGVAAPSEPFDATAYQTPEGGVALFPYAGQDLTLTARAAAVSADRFGTGGLRQSFLGVLEDRGETRERQLIALYGLAALGDPVLMQLQALLDEADLTWRERIYAGLAMMELGDDTTARQVYESLVAEYGERTAPTYRLRVGDDQDEILEATSLAAILGGGLGDSRAPQFFAYTTKNATTNILVELEQISYLAIALPRLSSEPVRLAYTVDGERTELTLQGGESFGIQLTAGQLANLGVERIEGAAGVAAFYTAPMDPASTAVDADVTVTRTYGKDPASLVEGELVQITLNAEFGAQALDGCYQLTDVLASGLRPVVRNDAWGLEGGVSYPYRIEGQRVSFCVSTAPMNQAATYWARVVSMGEYTAEPAIIQSMQSSERLNFSEADRVIIH